MNCWETWGNSDPARQWQQRDPQKSTVSDLIYRYLNKVAEENSKRKQRNNARSKFRREHAHRKKRLYSPTCLPSRERGPRRQMIGAEKTLHQTSDLPHFSEIADFSSSRQKSIADQRYPLNFFADDEDFYRCDSYPSSRDYNFSESDIFLNSTGITGITVESPSSPRLTSTTAALSAAFSIPTDFLQPPLLATIPPLMQSITVPQPIFHSTEAAAAAAGAMMTRHLTTTRNNLPSVQRRSRSEKKPIPDEQKDEKYYERRKRNNQAAKKSRDARKIREDHIALRATMLEHENAILRTQIVTLREEAQSLRHMLVKLQRPGTLRTAERTVSTLASPTIAISPSALSTSTTLNS